MTHDTRLTCELNLACIGSIVIREAVMIIPSYGFVTGAIKPCSSY